MSGKTPELTDAEVDMLLERFDLTEPKLQRKIVASIMARLLMAEDELAELKNPGAHHERT